jgi:plasmid stability protein
MGIMIQVRNVPPELHAELKRRATLRGQTLTAYVQGVLEREVETMDVKEWLETTLELEPTELDEPVADTIRRAREERDRDLVP